MPATAAVTRIACIRSCRAGAGLPFPSGQVAIAVATAFVAGAGGRCIDSGIYLMDNALDGGSTGAGSFGQLHSVVPVGSLVGFSAAPIDTAMGAVVEITGFQIVDGNVFGCAGYPVAQTRAYWIGQAMHLGVQ